MKALFEDLFIYGHHCNQQLANAFVLESQKIDSKSITIFSHILNAHHIWNNRILGRNSSYGVWDNHTVDEFAAIDRTNFEQTQQILKVQPLTDNVSYKTGNGQPFGNTVRDILFHVVNHSTYHRGQLALLFRQRKVNPLATDYILYKR